jgi:3-hydroxyisobutyrate dehydrogenase
MSGTFAYLGNAVVGSAIARGLESLGWSRSDDAAAADAVLTYFTHAGALEDAYFETDGLVKRAREGALLVDLSPSTPSFIRELSAVATVNDLRFVEAPIAVADPSMAEAFERENVQSYLASDDEGALGEAEALVKSFAATVTKTGSCGMAQLAKAACTAQVAAQVLGAVESHALFATAGAQAKASSVPAQSPLAERVLASVSSDDFEGDYTVELFMGDVAAAMTVADDEGLILPQLEATMHLLEVLAVIGGADMSPSALTLLYRDEQASADNGLDWTRAAGLFNDGHDHDHQHEHGHDDEGEYDDFDDYDEDDPFGFAGGFGGYSAN